jgi:hypothetical protein
VFNVWPNRYKIAGVIMKPNIRNLAGEFLGKCPHEVENADKDFTIT